MASQDDLRRRVLSKSNPAEDLVKIRL